jgi:hypothetical protein
MLPTVDMSSFTVLKQLLQKELCLGFYFTPHNSAARDE